MHFQVITQCARTLKNFGVCLDKAEQFARMKGFESNLLLSGRLAPDMMPLVTQIQSACDYLKLGAAWLSGQAYPQSSDDELTVDDLRVRIRQTVEYVEKISEGEYKKAGEQRIKIFWAPGKVVNGDDYLLQMTVPNVMFHVAMAYAILRKRGVDVGKMDFLGSINLVSV
jgi:hypothetical protein